MNFIISGSPMPDPSTQNNIRRRSCQSSRQFLFNKKNLFLESSIFIYLLFLSNNYVSSFVQYHTISSTKIETSKRKRAIQFQSTVDSEDSNNNVVKSRREYLGALLKSKLPKPPEDQILLLGDTGALFLYSFLDHIVTDIFEYTIATSEVPSSISQAMAESFDISSGVPVWFDPESSIPLSAALPMYHHITYAPALSTVGSASVLLATTWLICGYFTGAFLFENTIECSTRRVLTKTAQTWVFTCILMVSFALCSDSLIGCVNCLHKSVGLTKADADYIFDSLSVLVMWRFLFSTFLGNNINDEK